MRRIAALVTNLPPDSATYAEEVWSQQTEIAARILERLDLWGRSLATLLNADRRMLPRPVVVDRPGAAAERERRRSEKRGIDLAAISRFFSRAG